MTPSWTPAIMGAAIIIGSTGIETLSATLVRPDDLVEIDVSGGPFRYGPSSAHVSRQDFPDRRASS